LAPKNLPTPFCRFRDFDKVSLAVFREVVLTAGERKFTQTGNYVEPGFTEMMSVNMLAGTSSGLNDINTILLSESSAKAFFGSDDPINQLVKLNNKRDLKVVGVYRDFPSNSTFNDVSFLASWKLFTAIDAGAKDSQDKWDNNDYQIFAQLKPGADFGSVSAKIKDIVMKRDNPPAYKPEFFLHPMSKWHLYSDFKDGVNTGGLIVYVWLLGIIGSFVLLLACINFMNLSTARSEKRAKEVGIRKAIGSVRSQLVIQFFSESLLLALLAFVLAIVFVGLALPFFNQVADKKMTILWANPLFWLSGLGFSLLTGLIAGSYPALYLSSFQPVKVLKGAIRAGRFAAVPRQVLVGFQFTVSVTLIIGTIIVFRQIEHAKDRPVGYNRSGLIEVRMNTPELQGHYESLRNDLLETRAVDEMAESNTSITVQNGGVANITWRGQAADLKPLLWSNRITHEYGKTVGWRLVAVAFCIAAPLAYYVLSDWLQNYEYRTELSWWIFALTGLGAVLVTLLTVSFQSIKAALMNPVKCLRSE
jgi:putative ABC transport system permease protein